jgi:hypothetical protein
MSPRSGAQLCEMQSVSVTVADCVAIADLVSSHAHSPGGLLAEHHALLESYRSNLWRGAEAVGTLILTDLRCSLDLGGMRRATMLAVVLWLFLSEYPEAGYDCIVCNYFSTTCQYRCDIREEI